MSRNAPSRRLSAAAPARLGASLPRADLHPAALAWADARPAGERWAVACSAGADSTALLLLLRAHWPERRLVVLHFNHRLRGPESDADARHCAALCRRLGLECVVGRWRRPRSARPATEAEARAARHEFFAAAMASRRIGVLWLGHQQDDVAETMLMRLGRGSGTGGLAAPRPVQAVGKRWHVRPLLSVNRATLRRALRAAGEAWREDASNAGGRHLRNRVRSRVVPAWRASDPGRDVLAGAALARERLEEDDAALEQWLDRLRPVTPAGGLSLARLHGCPTALWRRALHRWLLRVRPDTDLSRQGFDQLLARLRQGGDFRFSLGAAGFAVARRGWLRYAFAQAGRRN